MTNQKKSEIVPLFPNPVALIEERKPSKKELKYIKELEVHSNVGNKTSNESNVLETKELSGLKKVIQERLDQYFQQVFCPQDDVGIRITQSWCNYSDGTDYHHKHSHANSVISGVYYPQSDHPEDQIMFHSPLAPYFGLKIYPKEFNLMNSQTWWLPAHTGTLLLFPSYLEHSVPTIKGRKTTRISLSFNTFYVGRLGNKEALTELILEE